ncbi:filamentous hemagglutinin N-terminal domain-containing protein [Proteus myxofaciens]|uniref:Hemolysin n=1 Tax=Proteus myxofaciens ATCC 19692 TaxID=1354337 RepID=A0A198GH23_9GAMM|nr:filamentous hemagglutinin N-terminal domain-containing protein [Proteus myxofaciens]OAT36747.1 hemolysin [Proteus myxofaciens ATCC 19692]
MKKTSLFTVSLLSLLVSQSCLAESDIVISKRSPDAEVYTDLIPIENTPFYKDGKDVIIVPNATEGVSHIYYDKFNVASEGIEFANESAGASLIINEVVSEVKSIIAGDIDIKGEKAQLIIANPNGIDCINDCSFSNLDKVIFITGSSKNKNSAIFDVSLNGKVNVNINNQKNFISKMGVFAIISNDIEIKRGKFDLEKMNITMGLNRMNFNTWRIGSDKIETIKEASIGKDTEIKAKKINIYFGNSEVTNNGKLNATHFIGRGYKFTHNGSMTINDDKGNIENKERGSFEFDMAGFYRSDDSSLKINNTSAKVSAKNSNFMTDSIVSIENMKAFSPSTYEIKGETKIVDSSFIAEGDTAIIDNFKYHNSSVKMMSRNMEIFDLVKGGGELVLRGDLKLIGKLDVIGTLDMPYKAETTSYSNIKLNGEYLHEIVETKSLDIIDE